MEAILWLVINLYYEAVGEPIESQKAIVHVVMNRADWDLKKVPFVIRKPYQFSWTSDPHKLKKAQKIIKDQRVPKNMKNLMGVVYQAIYIPFYERPSWDHYKAITSKSTWGCYPGGYSFTIFPGSGHVFCNSKDVVKPGNVPSYFQKRKEHRKWRKSKRSRLLDYDNC